MRIVVCGWTYWQTQLDNSDDARRMLFDALASEEWPAGRAAVAITPGGFIRARLPRNYDGGRGWQSKKRDLRKLIPHAEAAIRSVLCGKLIKKARKRTKLLTLGIDLNLEWHKEERIQPGHVCRPSCPRTCTHAELVAVLDTASGEVIRWTGKSYPVDNQQHTLVHVNDLRSHLLDMGAERILVLGCHDLNLLINRGRKPGRQLSPKQIRRKHMQKLAEKFRPTMILHHPHSTYSPNIWRAAWGAARAALPTARVAVSGIAFCGNPKPGSRRPWQTLDATISGTSWGHEVTDVVIDGCGS